MDFITKTLVENEKKWEQVMFSFNDCSTSFAEALHEKELLEKEISALRMAIGTAEHSLRGKVQRLRDVNSLLVRNVPAEKKVVVLRAEAKVVQKALANNPETDKIVSDVLNILNIIIP